MREAEGEGDNDDDDIDSKKRRQAVMANKAINFQRSLMASPFLVNNEERLLPFGETEAQCPAKRSRKPRIISFHLKTSKDDE